MNGGVKREMEMDMEGGQEMDFLYAYPYLDFSVTKLLSSLSFSPPLVSPSSGFAEAPTPDTQDLTRLFPHKALLCLCSLLMCL